MRHSSHSSAQEDATTPPLDRSHASDIAMGTQTAYRPPHHRMIVTEPGGRPHVITDSRTEILWDQCHIVPGLSPYQEHSLFHPKLIFEQLQKEFPDDMTRLVSPTTAFDYNEAALFIRKVFLHRKNNDVERVLTEYQAKPHPVINLGSAQKDWERPLIPFYHWITQRTGRCRHHAQLTAVLILARLQFRENNQTAVFLYHAPLTGIKTSHLMVILRAPGPIPIIPFRYCIVEPYQADREIEITDPRDQINLYHFFGQRSQQSADFVFNLLARFQLKFIATAVFSDFPESAQITDWLNSPINYLLLPQQIRILTNCLTDLPDMPVTQSNYFFRIHIENQRFCIQTKTQPPFTLTEEIDKTHTLLAAGLPLLPPYLKNNLTENDSMQRVLHTELVHLLYLLHGLQAAIRFEDFSLQLPTPWVGKMAWIVIIYQFLRHIVKHIPVMLPACLDWLLKQIPRARDPQAAISAFQGFFQAPQLAEHICRPERLKLHRLQHPAHLAAEPFYEKPDAQSLLPPASPSTTPPSSPPQKRAKIGA